jgi:glycosyltransferase involved in cell wall biosynthesis
MKILALTRYGRLGASSRLRTFQFLPTFEKEGLNELIQPLFDDEMLRIKYKKKNYGVRWILSAYWNRLRQLFGRHRFDLIWIEKEALPWMPAFFEKALLGGVPYVLDYDDAIFHNYDLHRSFWVRHLFGKKIDRLMKGARLVVAGNEYLAQRALKAGAVWVEVVPTVIDLNRYGLSLHSRVKSNVPRIVWIGSPSTVKYLAMLEPALVALAERIEFRLRVIGGIIQMPGVDIECVPWSEKSEVQAIIECDIGVMPLADSPWELGKCGYKLIQYMACSLPVVASPIGVNKKIVRDGINGFLARSPEDWVTSMERLLLNEGLRQSFGRAGRQCVEAEYCVQEVGPRLLEFLKKAGEINGQASGPIS